VSLPGAAAAWHDRALLLFGTLERQLDEELQVSPSEETLALVRLMHGPSRLGVTGTGGPVHAAR